MPMWRCPHCGTPQAETARCWVCHRSTTACATCRHFRRSVAAGLGFCTLDRERRPVRASDVRWCWEAPDPMIAVEVSARRGGDTTARPDGRRPRDFVEVPTTTVVSADLASAAPPPVPLAPASNPGSDGGWDLWGDASD